MEQLKTIYFWQPIQGDITTCLTQWYIAPFVADNIEYACAEQYMMAQKALLFKDTYIAQQIMQTTDPSVMKKLGRQVRNYDEDIWQSQRVAIVTKGNIAKFSDPRNHKLKEYLLSTGNAPLAEASPFDKIWGIGLDAQTAMKTPPSNWPGQNLLGQILMSVRTHCR
ncbi:MAG: NADAR family protein [Bacteroidales bacterium]|nr:NADAR family protein [Bacteroidales bacterium]